MSPAAAVDAYLVLVALFIGSFINLAADRVPRNESLVRPRSHCRSCGRLLNAIDLIPVAGYLIRRGRCASCGAQIGAAAPVIEAVCGVVMLSALLWLGPWAGGFVGLILVMGVGAAVVRLSVARGEAASRAR